MARIIDRDLEETAADIAFGSFLLLQAAGIDIPQAKRERIVNALAGIARKELGNLGVKRRGLAMRGFQAAGDDGVN